MIHHLIHINYATILIIVFLVTFLFCNTIFTKRVTHLFLRAIFCVLLLVIADSIESWTESLSYPTTLRILVSAIGYSCRPVCILYIILIASRSTQIKYRLLYVPAVINAIISFSALFTDIAFSYSPDNKFVRGPLGLSAYAASIIYLLIFLIISVYYLKERHIYESIIIFFINFIAILSITLEVIFKFDGFINAAYAVSIAFYYLFFHTQTSKRDVLTQAFNRRCFYDDAARDFTRIKGLISLDLNDLKKLNDTNGHACGDKALTTISTIIRNNIPLGCTLYRTGGDEFEILCLKYEEKYLEELIKKLRTEISKTPYSCAFGLAMLANDDTLDSLCARADAQMYADKSRIKAATK